MNTRRSCAYASPPSCGKPQHTAPATRRGGGVLPDWCMPTALCTSSSRGHHAVGAYTPEVPANPAQDDTGRSEDPMPLLRYMPEGVELPPPVLVRKGEPCPAHMAPQRDPGMADAFYELIYRQRGLHSFMWCGGVAAVAAVAAGPSVPSWCMWCGASRRTVAASPGWTVVDPTNRCVTWYHDHAVATAEAHAAWRAHLTTAQRVMVNNAWAMAILHKHGLF